MILSNQSLFSDQQAVTVTANSTNVIDLGVAGSPPYNKNQLNQDVGKGNPIPLLVQVTETFLTLTSLTISVVVADNEALTTNAKTLASETIAVADLVAGKMMNLQCVPDGADQRYLGLIYTVAGTTATAGKVTAGITMGRQTNITGA